MTQVQPGPNGLLYTDANKAKAGEGLTVTQFSVNKMAQDMLFKEVLAANRKLKTNGGKGQEGVQIIGGSVLTIKESAAVKIAEDVIHDTCRRLGQPLKDIPMIEFMAGLEHRVKGRICTVAEVLTEIGRLQNHARYGNKLAR